MMKILLVDDESYKSQQISPCVMHNYEDSVIKTCESLNAGLLEITSANYDFVLLDMSLPIYDKNEVSSFNSYGGLDFLSEMERKMIATPVIVVTQYEILGEGENQRTASSIDIECQQNYENYIGMVVYSAIDNKWKISLLEKIGEAINGKDTGC